MKPTLLNYGSVGSGEGYCTPICGDGYVIGSEQCDDGNLDGLDGCGADGVELQREHEAVNAIFTGSTDIIGGISGPGSNVYVCGVPGWVQTA